MDISRGTIYNSQTFATMHVPLPSHASHSPFCSAIGSTVHRMHSPPYLNATIMRLFPRPLTKLPSLALFPPHLLLAVGSLHAVHIDAYPILLVHCSAKILPNAILWSSSSAPSISGHSMTMFFILVPRSHRALTPSHSSSHPSFLHHAPLPVPIIRQCHYEQACPPLFILFYY